MNEAESTAWKVREYALEDIPAFVAVVNLEYSDEPTTIAQEEHWNRSYPPDNPRRRLAVEDEQGAFIGFGECARPFWGIAPGVYMLFIITRPGHRKRGIGRDLLHRLEAYGRGQGAEKLWTDCRENQGHSIRFLERAGFSIFGIRFESALDLRAFDPSQFAPVFDRIAGFGYRLTTLAELRKERPTSDRELYEVHHEGMKDVPLPGGMVINTNYDQWRKQFDNPTNDPAFFFLAMQNERIVGMTSIELLQDGPAITESTTVLREHRNRGVALALKVKSLIALKEIDRTEARTHNDTENPSIIHLNEKLGYRRLPGWLQWEKRL
jgi:ribosomal protein S18 acetylase RimI-like enzyme